ncbi:MAG TPA: hypothetical protein VHX86_07360 [Tepidisphaeraceae bacterium]|jgi:hypothetical protein|nr:hypothetical protein [Tepidisphaeraceae bacterium]
MAGYPVIFAADTFKCGHLITSTFPDDYALSKCHSLPSSLVLPTRTVSKESAEAIRDFSAVNGLAFPYGQHIPTRIDELRQIVGVALHVAAELLSPK